MASVTVVVTRPGPSGRALVDGLRRAGQPALWLPAFEFGAAPDEPAARAVLAELGAFDLAIFVSPQAARATAALLAKDWPQATAIAAVGAGTRSAVLASVAGAAKARLIAPDVDGEGAGSESLWPLLRAAAPRRVLLLRAQGGREWLAERLREAGSKVTALAVYTRRPHAPDEGLRRELAAAGEGGLASVVSSSDAVDALLDMLAAQPRVRQALRAGVSLATHPRIVERLRAAGFERVTLCAPDAPALLAALREAGG